MFPFVVLGFLSALLLWAEASQAVCGGNGSSAGCSSCETPRCSSEGLWECQENGVKLDAVGATRPICKECADAIVGAGAQPVTRLRNQAFPLGP